MSVAPASQGGVDAEARRLVRNTLVYLLPSLLVRGVTLILTPIYARALSPAEYGVIGVVNGLIPALTVVLGFALQTSIARLQQRCDDEAQRREQLGAALVFTLVAPTLLALAIEAAGRAGVFDGALADIRYAPYLRYAVWTAVLGLFLPLLTGAYMAKERSAVVALTNGGTALLQVTLTVLLVVVYRLGIEGALLGALVSAASSALVSIILVTRRATFSEHLRAPLQAALAYSVPLVPHALANWGLALSDRLILESRVAKDELGRYTFAYLFAAVNLVFFGAIINALHPMLTRRLNTGDGRSDVPHLGRYALVAMGATATLTVAFAPEALHVLAPPAYHAAAVYVPWLVAGALAQGVYWVASLGTWFSMDTRMVPFVSVLCFGANIGANLLLVPRHGALAAAWVTTATYSLLAVLHGSLAQRLHPISWEYRRWLGIAAAFGAVWLAAPHLTLGWRVGLSLMVAPALLFVFRGLDRSDLTIAKSIFPRPFQRTWRAP